MVYVCAAGNNLHFLTIGQFLLFLSVPTCFYNSECLNILKLFKFSIFVYFSYNFYNVAILPKFILSQYIYVYIPGPKSCYQHVICTLSVGCIENLSSSSISLWNFKLNSVAISVSSKCEISCVATYTMIYYFTWSSDLWYTLYVYIIPSCKTTITRWILVWWW